MNYKSHCWPWLLFVATKSYSTPLCTPLDKANFQRVSKQAESSIAAGLASPDDREFLRHIATARMAFSSIGCASSLATLGLADDAQDEITNQVVDFQILHFDQNQELQKRLAQTTVTHAPDAQKVQRFGRMLYDSSLVFGASRPVEQRDRIRFLQADFQKLSDDYAAQRDEPFCVTAKEIETPEIAALGSPKPPHICFAASTTLKRIIRDAESRPLREKAYRELEQRASRREATINKILLIRAEFAKNLGLPYWAGADLFGSLVKQPSEIDALLHEIEEANATRAAGEYTLIRREAEKLGFTPAPWDENYLRRRIDQALQSAAPELTLRDQDLELILTRLAKDVFGMDLQFDPSRSPDRIAFFSITSQNQPRGRYALDPFVRNNKSLGTAGIFLSLGETAPIRGVLAAAIPRGTADSFKLPVSDLALIFHEFGHLAQAALSPIADPYFIHENDVIEAPAVLLENLILAAPFMKRLLADIVPPQDVEKMVHSLRESRLRWVGLDTSQQLYLSRLSLALHMDPTPTLERTHALNQRLWRSARPYLTTDPPPYATFSHLVNMGAAYYTYAFSKVVAYDLFSSALDSKGDINPDWSKKYQRFLSHFGIADTIDLIQQFTGHPLSTAAYLSYVSGRMFASDSKPNKP